MSNQAKKTSMDITMQQGIDTDTARALVKKIKASGVKVQAAIQGDKVRVTGKKREICRPSLRI